jgi:hypothetical protein
MKGQLFVSSNVQNQFEARLTTFRILLYAMYIGVLFICEFISKHCERIFFNIHRYSF